MLLSIYVPKPDTSVFRLIAPKSAIVGDRARPPVDPSQQLVHYEGNLYHATNLNQYYERLISAAGRLEQHYPTIAMGLFPISELIKVAEFETLNWSVTTVLDAARLTDWAGEPLENITGIRLPCGSATWNNDVSAALKDARPHKATSWPTPSFQTRAGQIITLNTATRTAQIT